MKTALIFALAIFCGLTLCARKHAHLDYKTTDVAYPLKHKQYFDLSTKHLVLQIHGDIKSILTWKTEQMILEIIHMCIVSL